MGVCGGCISTGGNGVCCGAFVPNEGKNKLYAKADGMPYLSKLPSQGVAACIIFTFYPPTESDYVYHASHASHVSDPISRSHFELISYPLINRS